MKRLFCSVCICSVLLGCLPLVVSAEEVVDPLPVDSPVQVAAVDPMTALEVIYWGAEVVVLVKDGVEYALSFFDGDSSGDNVVNVGTDNGAFSIRNLLVPTEERPEGTLAGTMAAIFGPYQPLTYSVTTYVGDQYIVSTEPVPGLAGLDWPWLCGFSLFAICAWSVFRILGVMLA